MLNLSALDALPRTSDSENVAQPGKNKGENFVSVNRIQERSMPYEALLLRRIYACCCKTNTSILLFWLKLSFYAC